MKKISFALLILILTLSTMLILDCSRSGAVSSGKKDTAVYIMGGLGGNQTGFLAGKIKQDIPEVEVITFSEWDGWKDDIAGYALNNPHQHQIMIGHSYGCSSILNTTSLDGNIDLVILLDPVSTVGYHLTADSNILKTDIYYRSEEFGPKTANIKGNNITIYNVPNSSHNSLPNDPSIVNSIEQSIREVE